MRLTNTQQEALRTLAEREDHTATIGRRPLNPATVEKLADRGLVEVWSKTVVGVPIRKVRLSGAGAEALEVTS